MASYYTIAQYAPSPISDERINFGVFVFGDGTVRAHFVKNWERVRRFGAEMGLLAQFVSEATELSEDELRKLIEGWGYSIRFTEIRGSLLEPDKLLPDVAAEFLVDPPEHKAKYRHRRDAADLCKRSLATALKASIKGSTRAYLKSDLTIEGKKGTHYLDAALKNEELRVAARGLSFEIPPGLELVKEVNLTTLMAEDVAKSLPNTKFSVIYLPPQKTNDVFKRAIENWQTAGAEVVQEDSVVSWAHRSVGDFVSHHAPNKANIPMDRPRLLDL